MMISSLHVNDAQIKTENDTPNSGTNIQNIIQEILNERSSSIAIIILDCYRSYILPSSSKGQGQVR